MKSYTVISGDTKAAWEAVSALELELLLPNGKLKLLPSKYFDNIDSTLLQLFCHKWGRYGLPTIEVVDFIKGQIKDRTAIEIGSGHGDLGYHLGIPMTDSKIQKNPKVRAYYEDMRQPIIEYPEDVEEIEAIDAVKKYCPQVVVASWVTQWIDPNKPPTAPGSVYGVEENKLLHYIEHYILVGNLDVHGQKNICKKEHLCIKNGFIRSRATNPSNDRIFIWRGDKH